MAGLVASGCAGTNHSASPKTTIPSRRAGGAHLVVVIEENHSFHQVIGSPDAPRTNALARSGVLLTNSYAVTHPSLPNYIALTSGDTHGIKSDCGHCDIDVPNVIDQLETAKVSWHVYAQGYPGQCTHQPRNGAYAKKHVPFLYYKSVTTRPAVCSKVVGLDRLTADAKVGTLPTVSFVIPDLAHDMHGAGEGANKVKIVRDADQALGTLAHTLRTSPAWTAGSRLVVTWDEGGGGHESRITCCGVAKGGHIPTLVVGPGLQPGTDNQNHDHYSLLASIEARYGLSELGHAADPSSTPIAALVSASPR